jgi:hypothetical protein
MRHNKITNSGNHAGFAPMEIKMAWIVKFTSIVGYNSSGEMQHIHRRGHLKLATCISLAKAKKCIGAIKIETSNSDFNEMDEVGEYGAVFGEKKSIVNIDDRGMAAVNDAITAANEKRKNLALKSVKSLYQVGNMKEAMQAARGYRQGWTWRKYNAVEL